MKIIINMIKNSFRKTCIKTAVAIEDTKGEIASSTIGGIIAGVVILGLLIVAVNAFFPTFWSDMFASMKTKFNAFWA